jgi:hypothetical protein
MLETKSKMLGGGIYIMRYKVCAIIFFVFMISLSGCGKDTNGLKNSATREDDIQSTEIPTKTPVATTITDLQTDYTDLMELPKEYSEDMAIRDGVVVNKISSVLNPEYLYRFCDLFSDGSEAFVRVMSYTDEGEPVIIDVLYNNGVITMTMDFSRDSNTAPEEYLYKQQFKYLVAHNGLLYLSNHQHWKENAKDDDYRLFAYINNKAVWKKHLSNFSD